MHFTSEAERLAARAQYVEVRRRVAANSSAWNTSFSEFVCEMQFDAALRAEAGEGAYRAVITRGPPLRDRQEVTKAPIALSNELLTPREVAEFLRIPIHSAWRLGREQRVPGVVRVGRYLRFSRVEIERWVAEGGSLAPDPAPTPG